MCVYTHFTLEKIYLYNRDLFICLIQHCLLFVRNTFYRYYCFVFYLYYNKKKKTDIPTNGKEFLNYLI